MKEDRYNTLASVLAVLSVVLIACVTLVLLPIVLIILAIYRFGPSGKARQKIKSAKNYQTAQKHIQLAHPDAN